MDIRKEILYQALATYEKEYMRCDIQERDDWDAYDVPAIVKEMMEELK